MKLTLSAEAAARLRLPHIAGKFVFAPDCEADIPDAFATAMLKSGSHLYVPATEDNVRAAKDAVVKSGVAVDEKAVKVARATESLKAAAEKAFVEGQASMKVTIDSLKQANEQQGVDLQESMKKVGELQNQILELQKLIPKKKK